MHDPLWDEFNATAESIDQEAPPIGGTNGDSLEATCERKTRQILGLLNKAERTDNDEEALSLSAKAAALQAEWAITEGMIRAFQNGDEPARPTRKMYTFSQNKSFVKQRSELLWVLVKEGRCYMVLTGDRTSEIFGFEDDIEFVEQLYQSLLVQMAHEGDRALFAYENRHGKLSNRYAWRRNYYIGYAGGVALRLKDEMRRVVAEAERRNPGKAELVLVGRKRQSKQLLDEVYPPRTLRRTRAGGEVSDWDAYRKGRTDGAQANVNTSGRPNGARGHVGRDQRAIGGR
jgi:Protein of unknown function (DUF2786)